MSVALPRALALCPGILAWAWIAGCGGAGSAGGAGGAGQTGAGQGGVITGAGGSDPASTSSSSASSSASGGGEGGAGGGAGGQGGQGGAACVNSDPGEPNDTEATAYNLGTIGCKDSEPGHAYGVLARPDDVDWFVYDGQDLVTCQVNPTSGVTVTAGVARVCAYFECKAGASSTKLGSCPTGTSTDTSPNGRPGCCGTTDFTVSLDCDGTTDDESLVFLRVDDPTHAACAEYSVTFHY